MYKFSPNFIDEFFRLCFLKKDVYEICKNHVKYQYFPDELSQYKKILKGILNSNPDSLPSFGVISQQYVNDIDVQEAINSIKDANIVDKEGIIDQLEAFIKRQRFKVLNDKVVEMYSDPKNDRKEEAIQLQATESVDIVNFSLKSGTSNFLRVYSDFESQMKERQIGVESDSKKFEPVPFGIDIIDSMTKGGMDRTDTALWVMRSGVGKSTVLKWTGIYCSRLRYKVLHIQLEGSKDEAFDKYSQMWTKASYSNLRTGNFSSKEMKSFKNKIKLANASSKEIFIYSFDKFGEASMVDVRDLVIDYFKINQCYPDLVIIDSLDLISTGVNKKLDTDPSWKKEKMDKVAQLMKDIGTEFNTRVLTVTQASDFPGWNDPDQHLSRSNTEGNKTLVKPFSFVFTYNATREEIKANSGRVFIDKFRNYKIENDIFKIKTEFGKGCFYDRQKSLEMYKKAENI